MIWESPDFEEMNTKGEKDQYKRTLCKDNWPIFIKNQHVVRVDADTALRQRYKESIILLQQLSSDHEQQVDARSSWSSWIGNPADYFWYCSHTKNIGYNLGRLQATSVAYKPVALL